MVCVAVERLFGVVYGGYVGGMVTLVPWICLVACGLLVGREDRPKRRKMVAAAALCGDCKGGSGLDFFFSDFLKLTELMDNGGRICIWRMIDGQESSA